MALIDYIDGEERRIYLSVDTVNTSWHPAELYVEERNLRGSNEALRNFDKFIAGGGNIDKGGGKATERYFTLLKGTRLVPYNTSHIIDITGTLISDDGLEGVMCFDRSPLDADVQVDIQYAPKQVEVINLNFDDLVYSSFQNASWVDINSPYGDLGSTNIPNGNSERPVNTLALAVEVAKQRGFRTIRILESMDIVDNIAGFELVGVSSVNTFINVKNEAICNKTIFKAFTITGILDGDSEIKKCVVNDLTYFDGYLRDCTINGTITLSGSKNAILERCKTLDIGQPTVIDCNNSLQNLVIPNWSGPIIFENCTEDITIGVGVDAGSVIILPSCTGGKIATSGSGTMLDLSANSCYVVNNMTAGTDILNLKRLIEYLRPHHTGSGDMWFWNPYDGNDLWDGKAIDRGFKTFAKAHDSAGNANHDIIMCVSGNPTGLTISEEPMIITKDYLFVRGPGRDFLIKQPNNDIIPIDIRSRGVEISGLRVSSNPNSNVEVIKTTSLFTLVKNVYIENSFNGINFSVGSSEGIADNVKMHDNVGYGIRIEGDTSHLNILDCHIGKCGEAGLEIELSDGGSEVNITGYNIFHRNKIGINVLAGDNIVIDARTDVFNNTLDDIIGSDDIHIGSDTDAINIANKVLGTTVVCT